MTHPASPPSGPDTPLAAGGVGLDGIAAACGTPCYVYDLDAIVGAYRAIDQAFGDRPHLVCYSAKANESLAVLAALGAAGAGVEVVSGGELYKARAAGIPAARVVFGGVGKTDEELAYAVEEGVRLINAESEAELERLSRIASRQGRQAPVALRVNPDVDPRTHPYIATGLREHKFGIPWERALDAYALARRLPGLRVAGIDCHIGSQIAEAAPFEDAARRLGELARRLLAAGDPLEIIDLGGGLGIRYRDEAVPDAASYVRAIARGLLGETPAADDPVARLTWVVEPGRAIVGQAGLLLTRVLDVKQGGDKTFVVCDAGLTELLRPALYGAWHEILPVAPRPGAPHIVCDVVGPICESGDFLAQGRELPRPEPGDLLAVRGAGAYGAVMASRYNARPLCAEVVVRGGQMAVSRRRERFEDLVASEVIPELAR